MRLSDAEDYFRENLPESLVDTLDEIDGFQNIVGCANGYADELNDELREMEKRAEEAEERVCGLEDNANEEHEAEIEQMEADMFLFPEWLERNNLRISDMTQIEKEFTYSKFHNENS